MFPGQDIKLEIVSDFPHQVIDLPTVWIPLADGTRLAARIWRPVDAEVHPVATNLRPDTSDPSFVRAKGLSPWGTNHFFAPLRELLSLPSPTNSP